MPSTILEVIPLLPALLAQVQFRHAPQPGSWLPQRQLGNLKQVTGPLWTSSCQDNGSAHGTSEQELATKIYANQWVPRPHPKLGNDTKTHRVRTTWHRHNGNLGAEKQTHGPTQSIGRSAQCCVQMLERERWGDAECQGVRAINVPYLPHDTGPKGQVSWMQPDSDVL